MILVNVVVKVFTFRHGTAVRLPLKRLDSRYRFVFIFPGGCSGSGTVAPGRHHALLYGAELLLLGGCSRADLISKLLIHHSFSFESFLKLDDATVDARDLVTTDSKLRSLLGYHLKHYT